MAFRPGLRCISDRDRFLGDRPDGCSPTAGYKREPGMTSATVPAPLREIGFDQNLGQFVPRH
jgi:hypothetical protein